MCRYPFHVDQFPSLIVHTDVSDEEVIILCKVLYSLFEFDFSVP